MNSEVLDVDMLAFERGSSNTKQAVVDGVMKSLETGFVYTSHDMSQDFLDEVYGMLGDSFQIQLRKKTAKAEGTNGQRGYTGLLVETAAISDVPDWKEMLNWGKIYLQGIHSRSGIRIDSSTMCSLKISFLESLEL